MYDIMEHIFNVNNFQTKYWELIRLIFAEYTAIDCFLNSLCIFLSFDSSNKWYFILCGKLDAYIITISTNRSRNKLIKLNDMQKPLLELGDEHNNLLQTK
eukprot:14248_1